MQGTAFKAHEDSSSTEGIRYLYNRHGGSCATGQILSIYGILYPLIGDSITVIPDFEKPVMEGSFRFKGKITAFTLIRIAAKIYFDKDLKRVICLFKKEAVQNGRK